MSAMAMLSRQEWEKLFDERNFNPPAPEVEFGKEFDAALNGLAPILLLHAPAEEFMLWDKHNQARFIDVAFESEAYLQPPLVADIQKWLQTLKEDWMVCLWMSSFLFVTKGKILCFAPLPDDQAFLKQLDGQLQQLVRTTPR